MARLGQTMFDVGIGAGGLEGVAAEEHLLGAHRLDLRCAQALPDGSLKCVPLSGEHCVKLVGGLRQQEIAGSDLRSGGRLHMQLDEGESEDPVDRHEEVQFPPRFVSRR